MKEVKIELNSPPGGVYFPGMTVTGTVIAVNDKPKAYKAIEVKLKGEAIVHWSESRGQSSSVSYFASRAYLDPVVRVWDKDVDASAGGGVLPAGSYQFPFSLKLVGNNLPASYNGARGKIQYQLEIRVVKVHRGLLKQDAIYEANITVANIVHINRPDLLQPQSVEIRKTVCCLYCASGPIVITATIPRTGYYIKKDIIPLEVSVENGSNRDVSRIVASIHRQVDYYTDQGRNHNYEDIKLIGVASDPIRAHSSIIWCPSIIAVPDTPATSVNCDILQVNYVLRVVGIMKWAVDSLTIEFSLVLGNVPLPN